MLRGAAKIQALMCCAADDIEENGIACTSRLEQTLFDEMNGLCRDLMSAMLSGAAEKHCGYEPAEGERNSGRHGKRIVTLFGETPEIMRTSYYDPRKKRGHFPFDDRLGLVGRYTPAVAQEAARYAVDHPYGGAAAKFSRTHGFRMSADTVRHLVRSAGRAGARFAGKIMRGRGKGAGRDVPLACVMADGTGIPLRKSSLRGVKGKSGAAKTREVKAGAVFVFSRDSDRGPHRDIGTTTYVATTDRSEKFGRLLRSEFDRRFRGKPGTVLYITDGGRWLHTVHETRFRFAVEILDIFHAVEHLKPLMLGLGFRENTGEWKRKYGAWRKRIRRGHVEGLLKLLREEYGDRLSGDALREYNYYRNNASRMRYDEYRANGWFVGSGVIESACKTVIGQRFKLSGMNWSLKGAKALLPLRTLHMSERLEEFFRYELRKLPQVRCVSCA